MIKKSLNSNDNQEPVSLQLNRNMKENKNKSTNQDNLDKSSVNPNEEVKSSSSTDSVNFDEIEYGEPEYDDAPVYDDEDDDFPFYNKSRKEEDIRLNLNQESIYDDEPVDDEDDEPLYINYKKSEPEDVWIDENDSTVTNRQKEKGVVDEYGVIYSSDGKRLLGVTNKFSQSNNTSYSIKEGTEVICDHAFIAPVSHIDLPDSLRVIGYGAFSSCRFKHLEIPKNVCMIKSMAFNQCDDLESVVIKSNIDKLGDSVFSQCKYLISVVYDNETASISPGMFDGCLCLKRLSIPQNIKLIEKCEGVDNYKSRFIEASSSLEELIAFAFNGCGLLHTVIINDHSYPDCSKAGKEKTVIFKIEIPEHCEVISCKELGLFFRRYILNTLKKPIVIWCYMPKFLKTKFLFDAPCFYLENLGKELSSQFSIRHFPDGPFFTELNEKNSKHSVLFTPLSGNFNVCVRAANYVYYGLEKSAIILQDFRNREELLKETNIENFDQYLCVDEDSPLLKE